VHILEPVRIEVRGTGVCGEFKLDLGNGGYPLVEKNFDFSQGSKVYPQIYFHNGWPGPKTVSIEGVTLCKGKVTTTHRVLTEANSTSEELNIPINNPSQLCYRVPSAAPRVPLRKNTTVRVTSPATPKVNFGCSFNGCIYDADGKAGTSAPSSFPYPGLREYSLVMAVGNQYAQGGRSESFVTTQSGELLMCFNDGNGVNNNSGGWQVNIFVDERNAIW
jgi:hypothetical protein